MRWHTRRSACAAGPRAPGTWRVGVGGCAAAAVFNFWAFTWRGGLRGAIARARQVAKMRGPEANTHRQMRPGDRVGQREVVLVRLPVCLPARPCCGAARHTDGGAERQGSHDQSPHGGHPGGGSGGGARDAWQGHACACTRVHAGPAGRRPSAGVWPPHPCLAVAARSHTDSNSHHAHNSFTAFCRMRADREPLPPHAQTCRQARSVRCAHPRCARRLYGLWWRPGAQQRMLLVQKALVGHANQFPVFAPMSWKLAFSLYRIEEGSGSPHETVMLVPPEHSSLGWFATIKTQKKKMTSHTLHHHALAGSEQVEGAAGPRRRHLGAPTSWLRCLARATATATATPAASPRRLATPAAVSPCAWGPRSC